MTSSRRPGCAAPAGAVEIDSGGAGSAEGGPETLAEFHKRDRRWCQGNMQHLRLIGARGLHPVSRLHLALGIGGYLAAPLWLGLVVVAILAGSVDGHDPARGSARWR